MAVDIDAIMNEEVRDVNLDTLQLPQSMQQDQAAGDPGQEQAAGDPGSSGSVSMSLEDLSRVIIEGYNVVSCVVWRKIESGYDASLNEDEKQAIDEPLKMVLQEYNVQVTPVTALVCTLIGINVGKYIQLKMYRAEKAKVIEQDNQDNYVE